MPIFIDGHEMVGLTAVQLKNIINNAPDKHGVTHQEILYNEKANKLFCILEAPDRESIIRHHQDVGIECDFIVETTYLKTESQNRLERLSAIGELSARLAHDLRNPLGVIKNAVELMEASSKDSIDDKLKKRVEMIKNAGERMSRQINDILDFARTRPLQLEKNSFAKILDSSLKSSILGTIKISKPQNDVTILCDSKQIEVVLSNIITNAVQAMENAGEIKVRLFDNQNYVKIEIEDSGPGIPKDELEKIFEPLFTTKPRGTGLGLASCKNIVEQHGGNILAKNNPTTFEIKLPKR